MYTDKVSLIRVIPYERKETLEKAATAELYGNKLLLRGEERELTLSFDEISALTVLGKNKVNIYIDKEIYQLKGDERFNALKYVHIYHRYRNIKEAKDGKFLGI